MFFSEFPWAPPLVSIRQGPGGGSFPTVKESTSSPIRKKSISRFVGLSEFRSGLADGSGSRFWFRRSRNPPRGVREECFFLSSHGRRFPCCGVPKFLGTNGRPLSLPFPVRKGKGRAKRAPGPPKSPTFGFWACRPCGAGEAAAEIPFVRG